MRKFIGLLWLAGLWFAPLMACAADAIRFEPEFSQLSGLVLGDYSVAPDKKMTSATLLWLSTPVSVEGIPASTIDADKHTISGIKKVLLEDDASLGLKDMLGKKLTLEGMLFYAPSYDHETKITMKVQKVLGAVHP
jgi:hypothetical protein